MSNLVNFAAIPLDMNTCKGGGFFNQEGGVFNKKCCDVLNTAGEYTAIPTVESCPLTRGSCIFMQTTEIWADHSDECCGSFNGLDQCPKPVAPVMAAPMAAPSNMNGYADIDIQNCQNSTTHGTVCNAFNKASGIFKINDTKKSGWITNTINDGSGTFSIGGLQLIQL